MKNKSATRYFSSKQEKHVARLLAASKSPIVVQQCSVKVIVLMITG